jgi:hypothetical protein
MTTRWPINWNNTLNKAEKRKKPSNDDDDSKRKSTRKFNCKWLRYDEEKNLMFCTHCRDFVASKKNYGNYPVSFVKGCSNFRSSAIADHESSRLHQDSSQHERAKCNPENTIAKQTLVRLNEHKRKQLEIHFRNVHALVKHNRPIKDVEWLIQLDKAKGVDCGETYANRKSATTFLEYMSWTESQNITKLVQSAHFFSLSMDGSTDEGSVEQETLFVRICINGQLQTKFLCIGEPSSTSASHLHEFVNEQMKAHGLDYAKLVGFGCDGAANMVIKL